MSCLLIATEDSNIISSEIVKSLETENSVCLINTIEIDIERTPISYFNFTKEYGIKYNKEDKFKYTNFN